MLKKTCLISIILLQNIFFVLQAQSCFDFSATITDVNMSVFIHQNASTTLQEMGISTSDTLGVFHNEQCVGIKTVETDFFAFSLWGDDSNTELQEGLTQGESPSHWLIKATDNKIYHLIPVTETTQGWQNDGILEITNFQLDFISTYGCQDPSYMEYWSLNNEPDCDDGSCKTPTSLLLVDEFTSNENHINLLNDSIYAQNNNISILNNYNDSVTTLNNSLQLEIDELDSNIDSISNILFALESENIDLTDSLNLNLSQISTLNNTIDSISNENESLDQEIVDLNTTITNLSNEVVSVTDTIIEYGDDLSSLNMIIDSLTTPIFINLAEGWNIIGFSLLEPHGVVYSFDGISDQLIILKNNSGNVYMPEFNFNGIGMLIPGQGYQLKTTQAINDFYFYPN